jgi:hypothetical protein
MSLVFFYSLSFLLLHWAVLDQKEEVFLNDIAQADWGNIGSAMLGGAVFNAANILLTAAIALAGMSVAFPVGIGLALVLGVIIHHQPVIVDIQHFNDAGGANNTLADP